MASGPRLQDSELVELTLAANRVRYAFGKMSRKVDRLTDTRGDRHIERIIKEIIDGVPGRDPALRLLVASDFAEVLDRAR